VIVRKFYFEGVVALVKKRRSIFNTDNLTVYLSDKT
jgi:hypothetical protein